MPSSHAVAEAQAGDAVPTLARARPLLGTFVSIRVDAPAGAAAKARTLAAIDAAFERIAELQRCMSFQDPASDLSALNRAAHLAPQPVCPPLARVLRAALALAHASEGRFDPCVAGRLVEWGLLPAPEGDGRVDPRASWRDVELDGRGRVRFRRRLWLDLGGIAKGYAVDQAVRVLERHGVPSGTVNAGGDLRCFGRSAMVTVRDPADPARALPLLELRDAAVATSAGYFAADRRRSALVDPIGGGALGRRRSVSVAARRAVWADALTKVVLAAPEAAAPVLARLGARALLLDADGGRRTIG